jgi:hypothetical protein
MKKHSFEARTMVFVDLENGCGGSRLVPEFHKGVRRAIDRQVAGSKPLIVYSTGPEARSHCPTLWWEWQDARFLHASGINGADNALLEAMLAEPCAWRSDRVILVSGDHAFVAGVSQLRERGIHVTVMARPGTLSYELARVASRVVWLPTNFDEPATNEMRKSA